MWRLALVCSQEVGLMWLWLASVVYICGISPGSQSDQARFGVELVESFEGMGQVFA